MKFDVFTLEALIAQAAEGSHASFAEIYKRTHLHLFGVAIRILGQGQAAEDALQEAYVSIWKNAASYRTNVGGQTIQAMTWLIAITRNKALDAYRAKARRKENQLPDADQQDSAVEDIPDHTSPSAVNLLMQATHTLRIDGCMNELSGSHRQSLALAYYQGLSHSEVAAQMGAPLGSVKTWIKRGLEKLKTCLAAQGIAGNA